MATTVDWAARIVESTTSIMDLVAFKDTLRDLEDDAVGMLYPSIITYKKVDLGGGAFFHAVEFVNGYQLKFPNAGNYEIQGNLGATIVPVAGVYVERKTSAAFATTSSGGSGPTSADIAAAVHQRAVEGSLTLEQAIRLLLAPAAGDATGLDGATQVFKSQDGTKDRIEGTVANGTRTITGRDVT